MLIKEYRILIPLTVEEYRIAQLYMIAKKSAQDSSGAGSGVEIMRNEPYENGPGGRGGQYTYKIFHIGNHLPSWFRGILPKSALVVEEEAWNAYPYTKTRYMCPFVEKLTLEVETYFYDDAGTRENVFGLSGAELNERVVDVMDFVKDPISIMDYCKEEDPKLYVSAKTGRGPLTDEWVDEFTKQGKPVMCAYKLCKVEFKYWGMQARIEKFIHDIALRKTMLRAHRQAWAWQDEWHGKTIADIRHMERETQAKLKALMRRAREEAGEHLSHESPQSLGLPPVVAAARARAPGAQRRHRLGEDFEGGQAGQPQQHGTRSKFFKWWNVTSKVASGSSHSQLAGAMDGRDALSSLVRADSSGEGADSDTVSVYYDAVEIAASPDGCGASMMRWSSVEGSAGAELTPPVSPTVRPPGSLPVQDSAKPEVSTLLLMFHGGSVYEGLGQQSSPQSALQDLSASQCDSKGVLAISSDSAALKVVDVQTVRATLNRLLAANPHFYSGMHGSIATQLVPCANFATAALRSLASISPYGASESQWSALGDGCCHPALVTLLSADSPAYDDALRQATRKANQVYEDFINSDEGRSFDGEVHIIADALGGLLAYDMLVRQRRSAVSRHASSLSAASDISAAAIPETEEMYLDAARVDSIDDSTPIQECAPGPGPSSMPTNADNPNGMPHWGDLNESTGSNNVFTRTSREGNETPLSADKSRRERNQSVSSECSVSSVAYAYQHQQQCAASTSARGNAQHVRPHSHSSSPAHPQQTHRHAHDARRDACSSKLQFKVTNVFLFGSPLAALLTQRRMSTVHVGSSHSIIGVGPGANDAPPDLPFDFVGAEMPACDQVYNMYYPLDPCAGRLEPLLCSHIAHMLPVHAPRYARFPLGDGQPLAVAEHIRRHRDELVAAITCSGPQHLGPQAVLQSTLKRWWGVRRLDYALYCPEGLAHFPQSTLPAILHASYWENVDVMAFVLRALSSDPNTEMCSLGARVVFDRNSSTGAQAAVPPQIAHEKWLRKRTAFKIKNAAANHRANDVVVREGQSQIVQGRFAYGPLDVVALSGEKVDIYVHRPNHVASTSQNSPLPMPVGQQNRSAASAPTPPAAVGGTPSPLPDPTAGKLQDTRGTFTLGSNLSVHSANVGGTVADHTVSDWLHCGTAITDNSGRATFELDEQNALSLGVHPVKMVVRGDRTYLDMFLAVLPADTDSVIFSIDGSFTASVSVSGKDPKVRPGAVDIVRHWQELGYLILYITARPDMQQRKVVAWLGQHNFPHGLLFFTGGISTDPLRQKTLYLQKLVQECGLNIAAAYGSSKDVPVYMQAGLPSNRIFVVGKTSANRKNYGQVHCLAEAGYSGHLCDLALGGSLQWMSKAAASNGRLALSKGFFSVVSNAFSATYRVPASLAGASSSVHRSQSFTPRSGKYECGSSSGVSGNTLAAVESPRARGLSPFRMTGSRKK